MATRGWGGPIALALGIAGGIAAAELGMGYGLDIITWPTATDAAGEHAWLASLAWTTWLAATATVLGAIAADGLSRVANRSPEIARVARQAPGSTVDHGDDGSTGGSGGGPRPSLAGRTGAALAGTARRVTICLAAAIGGLLTVPLVAVPARAAHRPETYAPQVIAGGYAVVGVIVGLVVAIAALHSRAIAANLCVTGGWLWALAIVSAVYGVSHPGGDGAQLAMWRFGGGHFLRQTFSLPGAALMLGMAILLGVLAALPAARRADSRVGTAVSGAFGPLLVAAAYFLAAPKLTGARGDEQLSAYLIAPYAVIAGLAGSVALVALVTHREQRTARATGALSDPAASTGPAPIPATPGDEPDPEATTVVLPVQRQAGRFTADLGVVS